MIQLSVVLLDKLRGDVAGVLLFLLLLNCLSCIFSVILVSYIFSDPCAHSILILIISYNNNNKEQPHTHHFGMLTKRQESVGGISGLTKFLVIKIY